MQKDVANLLIDDLIIDITCPLIALSIYPPGSPKLFGRYPARVHRVDPMSRSRANLFLQISRRDNERERTRATGW